MEWLPIGGYEGLYEVSSEGMVRSLDRVTPYGRRISGRVLKLAMHPRGDYKTVTLSRDGKMRTHSVHSLVAEAFLGPRPEGAECCHSNGNGGDNRAANLRWGTHAENVGDTLRHGTHNHARKTRCKRGHPFSAENTYVWRNPQTGSAARICRTCQQQRAAKRAA